MAEMMAPSGAKPEGWKAKLTSPAVIVTVSGAVLLSFTAIVPIWTALYLLEDSNYIFWVGRQAMHIVIASCIVMIALYVLAMYLLFRFKHTSKQVEQTIMMIASIFITLFGVFLMIASLPLTHQVNVSANNLLHNCDHSQQTHRLYEYSQVLQNIRTMPKCANKFSVEECEGYQDVPPYTTLLKAMELNYHCAGFCISPPEREPIAFNSSTLLSIKQRSRQRFLGPETSQPDLKSRIKGSVPAEAGGRPDSISWYPPTLFTDRNYKVSCEGMAARDLKDFAGLSANIFFYYGTYLVVVAVCCGMLKLFGFTVKKQ